MFFEGFAYQFRRLGGGYGLHFWFPWKGIGRLHQVHFCPTIQYAANAGGKFTFERGCIRLREQRFAEVQQDFPISGCL
jgi:hypothetical protein